MIQMVTTTPERVDEEINKCAVKLSNLRIQKNSFLPIFRLPPETLANVFIHAACDYHEHSYRLRSFRVPHWVNVSYVCCQWRNVALNCPTLWAYHFTVSPRWTTELLARSKQALLKINVGCSVVTTGKSWCSRLLENVLSQAERFQELRLAIPYDILPTELSLDAPRLQVLDIDFCPHAPEQTLTINNGDSLLLHTLVLSYCPLPWHSTLNLSSVTILSLCHIPSQSQQEIPEFLTTLSRMQALTVLHVERSLPSARDFLSSEALGVSPQVTLPRLARIDVCAPLSTVIALLSCVNIPLKAQVRLDIEEDDSAIDDYAQLPSLIAHRFSQSETSSGPIIRSLIVHFTRDSMFTLSASELGDCDVDMPLEYGPQWRSTPLRIHVNMKQSIAMNDRARIAGEIFCAVPSTHVQTLQISDPPSSSDLWRTTLGHLDGLRYIRLGHGKIPSIASLFDVLAEGPEDAISSDDDQTRGYTFVPALEEVELYRMRFFSVDDMMLLRTLSRSTRKALDFTLSQYEVRLNEY